MFIRSLIVLGVLMLGAASAEAEHSYYARSYQPHAHVGVVAYPHGFYAGGGLVATRVLHQDGGAGLFADGAGLALFGGLRLHPNLALEAGWTGTVHGPEGVAFNEAEHLVLNGFTGDARVYLQPVSERSGSIDPYVQGGLGLYLLDSTYFGTQSVGTGFQFGGGVDLRLSANAKLGFRALYRGMAMGPPEAGHADTYVGALSAEGNLMIQF